MAEHRQRLLEIGALLKALGHEREGARKGMFRKGELYYLPFSSNIIGVIKCDGRGVMWQAWGITECTQSFGWEACMGRATRKTWCTWN